MLYSMQLHAVTALQNVHSVHSAQFVHPVQSIQTVQFSQFVQSLQSLQSVQSVQLVQFLQYAQFTQSVQYAQFAQSVQFIQYVHSAQTVQYVYEVSKSCCVLAANTCSLVGCVIFFLLFLQPLKPAVAGFSQERYLHRLVIFCLAYYLIANRPPFRSLDLEAFGVV